MVRACAMSGDATYCSARTSSAPRHAEPPALCRPAVVFMGVLPVIIAFFIGSGLGILAGYAGGWVNTLIMRVVDVFSPSVGAARHRAVGRLGAGILNAIGCRSPSCSCRRSPASPKASRCRSRPRLRRGGPEVSGALPVRWCGCQVLGNVLGPVFVYSTSLISVSLIRPRAVFSASREAAGAGMGLMLNTCAPRSRHRWWGPAGGDDLPHLDLVQSSVRRPALGDGGAAIDPRSPRPRRPASPCSGLRPRQAFRRQGGLLGRGPVVRAVDGVDFTIAKGEEPSASSASRAAASHHRPPADARSTPDAATSCSTARSSATGLDLKTYRRQVQMVLPGFLRLAEPGPDHRGDGGVRARRRTACRRGRRWRGPTTSCAGSGLEPRRFGGRYPHEVSGGQRARGSHRPGRSPWSPPADPRRGGLGPRQVGRGAGAQPDRRPQARLRPHLHVISHDLNVVRFMSDRVMVMYLGKIAEIGPATDILKAPRHPYTAALLASQPSTDPSARIEEAPLTGDPPNPINPPPGCRFHTRCPLPPPTSAAPASRGSIGRAGPPRRLPHGGRGLRPPASPNPADGG